MTGEGDRWHLIVLPLPDETVPGAVRMRRWLKAGLRHYAIRCVSVGDRCPDGRCGDERGSSELRVPGPDGPAGTAAGTSATGAPVTNEHG